MCVLRKVAFIILATQLSGCGTYIPTISEPWEPDDPGDIKAKITPLTSSGQLELEVKKNIYCELRKAFIDLKDYKDDLYIGKTHISTTKWLPSEWGAQMSLTMEVDENGSLNPAFSYITRLNNAKNHMFGVVANISSTATRLDKYNSYFNVGALQSPRAQHDFCESEEKDPIRKGLPGRTVEPSHSSFLTGSLGIESWLMDALTVDRGIPSYGAPASASLPSSQAFISPTSAQNSKGSGKVNSTGGSPPNATGGGQATSGLGQDAVSIEIKFVIITSGTANPSWTLQRITADTAATPLLSEGRTRTHDLILTVGPPNAATDYANLSLQIGQAFGTSSRTLLNVP